MRRGDYHEGMDRVLTARGLSKRPPGKNVSDSPCAAYPERDQIRQSPVEMWQSDGHGRGRQEHSNANVIAEKRGNSGYTRSGEHTASGFDPNADFMARQGAIERNSTRDSVKPVGR